MDRKNHSRKPKNDHGSSGLKPEYLLIGAVVLGLGYLALSRGKNSQKHLAAENIAPAPEKSTQIELIQNNEPKADPQKYQQELNLKRIQYANARILGLKTLDFKEKGDTVSIPFSFVPRKIWCQGGDLDTMKYASKSIKSKDFVISLEPIGRPGGKNPHVRASLQELYAGLSYTFTIPRPKEALPYGLYICTDQKQDNSCQRKGLESHAEMSNDLAKNPTVAKDQDRIFYFQNIILDKKGAEAYRTDNFSHEFQKSIGSHLSKQGINAADFQTAWNLNTTIKSSPADIREGKIILSLPYNDPRCTQGMTGAGPRPAR